eukprot:COSAG05_NODE_9766_length_602_cov_1.461233_1_plen_21_part_01
MIEKYPGETGTDATNGSGHRH